MSMMKPGPCPDCGAAIGQLHNGEGDKDDDQVDMFAGFITPVWAFTYHTA